MAAYDDLITVHPCEADTPQEAADLTADFIFGAMAQVLGVTEYTPCDGTETWEGDVAGTVYRILRAARVLDDENQVARHPASFHLTPIPRMPHDRERDADRRAG